ncbi:MAG: DoxX family protein [Cytophagaceae bacterium]|nr:DoxX family protein [Cytophagaceae bacterium]
MKILTHIARIIVGVLFIVSGFVKLNDPMGFSFKLQEYFSPGVLNLEFLSPFALGLAILLVIIEVIVGISLLIGYMRTLTLTLLTGMIVFFTFLTFYSAYFNKVTDCGCFGDAIPLTPWQSFTKDVILLVLILFLIINRKYILPLTSKFTRTVIIFFSFIACLAFGYHVLMHLPWLDFRAYKEGVNITEGMSVPEGAPEAVFKYHWKFNVNGEEKIITTTGAYPDSEGEFISVDTEEVQKGYEPPIHDFSIEKDGEDFTQKFLSEENLIMVISYNLNSTEWNGWPDIKDKTDEALKKGYTVIGLTSSGASEVNELKQKQKLNFDFYTTDETALKTIVRSNPGILRLKKGTIIQKRHWNDTDEIELETLPTANPDLDLSLKRNLDSIKELEAYFKPLYYAENINERMAIAQAYGLENEEVSGNLLMRKKAMDTASLKLVKQLLDTMGYPGKDLVGEPTNLVALEVIANNPEQIPMYLDTIKKAAQDHQLPFTLVAALEDRYLMHTGEAQIYGTQALITKNGGFIWPIKAPESVNERRRAAGFKDTIEEYSKDLLGEDYVFTTVQLDDVQSLYKI